MLSNDYPSVSAESLSSDTDSRTSEDSLSRTITRSDCWTFRESTVSFEPHIGAIAGRAIYAVGKAEINAFKWTWYIFRRKIIESRFPHHDSMTTHDLDGMYNDLVDCCRIDTYGVRIITWARQILIVQIETGCTNYLQKAVIRAPREVQVAALYNLCIPAWRTEDSRSLASIDAFMDSLFQQLLSASIPQFKSPDVFHAGMLAALTFRYSKNMTRVQDQSSQFIECVQLTAVLHHRPLMKSILSSIASIGFRLRSEERHVESLCAFRTAYAVHSRPFDADSRECLETLYGLASSLQALGRFSEAQIYYERAMTGYEKIFRSDYRDSLHAAYGLAETLRKRGQLSNTIISKRESLESYEHMWDANYEDVVEAVFSFTEDLPNHTHVQEADAHYRHALEGYERIRGAHNIETLDAVFGLAASLRLQGRFTQADPSYLRAHNGFKKQLSNDHRKALRVAAGLQECLEHQRPMVSLASKGERVDPD